MLSTPTYKLPNTACKALSASASHQAPRATLSVPASRQTWRTKRFQQTEYEPPNTTRNELSAPASHQTLRAKHCQHLRATKHCTQSVCYHGTMYFSISRALMQGNVVNPCKKHTKKARRDISEKGFRHAFRAATPLKGKLLNKKHFLPQVVAMWGWVGGWRLVWCKG